MTMLEVLPNFYAGIDVGGTKVAIADTLSTSILRYSTADFSDMESLLEDYFQQRSGRPKHVVIGMAGPRDDEDGSVKGTNFSWPTFYPQQASQQYPGTAITTTNDMVITAAGIISDSSIDFALLKSGIAKTNGPKLTVALSTGIGVASALWDEKYQRYFFAASEGGHIGVQPKTELEHAYIRYLQAKTAHVSAEQGLSGRHGIENLINHALDAQKTPKLAAEVAKAKRANNPVGVVLRDNALYGEPADKAAAQQILNLLGGLTGSLLRDLALVSKATGGIYLTGSMALGLGEYLAEHTALIEQFVGQGAAHADWLQNIPIYLVTDPDVATKGALLLAQS